jgi:hypothetical protein
MRSTIPLTLSISISILAACGEPATAPVADYDGPTEITLDDGSVMLAPAPPPKGQQLTSDRFTVPAGEERYFCYTFRSPADGPVAITAIEPIAQGLVHHEVVFQTIVDEPEGFFECPILVKASWRPIWAGGAGARGLTLPQGVAFKTPANTQYLVQYHLLNTSTKDITSRAAFNLSYADDPDVMTAAGLFAMGSFGLSIPAATNGYQLQVKCNSDKELKVFAAFPHQHELGKRVSFETGTTPESAAMAYEKNPWVFGDQPMDPVDFTIRPGDFMRTTCEWDNPNDTPVTYGESTRDEMCFMVLFYYPFEQLDGCLD